MKSFENQALSKYKSWDYEISLKKKITSEKLLIYQLLLEKLQELKNIWTVIYEENIYDISWIRQNIWLFSYQKKWKMMIVYKLSETQQDNSKKQISAIINWKTTRMTKKNQVIYETRYSRKIL